MTPEKLFHELLGLGLNWKVTECEFDRESGVVRLRIEETEHLWKVERSPNDGAEVACYDHTEEMVWRHLYLFKAYGIKASQLDLANSTPERLSVLLDTPEPEAWVVRVDPNQSNWPSVSSRILSDGRMVSNPLYDMMPALAPEVASQVSVYLPPIAQLAR